MKESWNCLVGYTLDKKNYDDLSINGKVGEKSQNLLWPVDEEKIHVFWLRKITNVKKNWLKDI